MSKYQEVLGKRHLSADEITPEVRRGFWAKVNKSGHADDCWPWKGATRKGHGVFSLRGKAYVATRIAWLLTKGQYPAERYVCHRCDTPRCVNPGHLFLGTPAENSADATRKGRQARVPSPRAKVKMPTGEALRALRKGGLTYAGIAALYGVTSDRVQKVARAEGWG